jgi:Bacterial Ig-like domain
MGNSRRSVTILLSSAVLVIAVVLAAGGTAYAVSGYLTAFEGAYPAAVGTRIDACLLCHVNANPNQGSARNPFGSAYSSGGHNFDAALEALDSDGDGFTNLEEITALTFPGDASDFPAAVDNTAPTVTSTSPDNNATGVAVTANISATFDEPIDPASVDGFVTDGVDNVAGTLSVVGSTATFTPDAPLADNTVYTATLTTAVMDLAGNPLAADYIWSFTTEVASTPPPSTSSSDGGGGGCSVIGSGGNGGGGALLFLALLSILVAMRLRRQTARAGR